MSQHYRKHGELPANGFVRLSQLVNIVPFSASTIWRKVKSGEFPKPIKLSERVTAWPVQSLRVWLEEHGAQ